MEYNTANFLESLPTARTANEWVEMAAAAEREGALDAAVTAYNKALALDDGCADALFGLAELRRDLGEIDRAQRLARRLADLKDPRAASLLAGLVEDEQLRDEQDAPSPQQRPADESAPPRFTDSDLVTMAELFTGRRGVYARQWVAPDGRAGYSPVREPLTPAVLRAHLLGACTAGIYVVRQDNTTHLLALDVDAARSQFDELAPKDAALAVARTLEVALGIARTAASVGLFPLLESSGRKGHHVWVFFDEAWPAWKARRLARALAGPALPLPADVAIDVFPAQAEVKQGGLGNLIKLPLGVHRKTGQRALLLEDNGTPCADPMARLGRVRRAPLETLEAALLSLSAQAPLSNGDEPTRPREFEAQTAKDDEAPQTRPEPSSAVAVDPYELDADEELAFLLARCTALHGLAAKARSGASLTHDEQNVLTYTVGHLTQGPSAVAALLAVAGNVAPPMGHRLRGHPTSCPKVRSRLGLRRSKGACDCEFDASLGSYPHPLLHLASLRAEQELCNAAFPPSEVRPPEELARLRQERERLHAERERLGRMLEAVDRRLAAAAPVVLAPQVKALPAPRPVERAAGED